MYLSMSLSMSMDYDTPSLPIVPSNSPGPTPVSSPLVTPAPIVVIVNSDRVATIDTCIGQPSTNVTVSFEVELAAGTETLSDGLTQFLANYLSLEYPSCAESRRVLATGEGEDSTKQFQQGGGVMRLGAITVEETGERCVARSVLASSCRKANAEIEVFGDAGDATNILGTSLQSLTKDDEEIANQLMMAGIVHLRVVDTTTAASSDEISSEANSSATSADGNGESGRTRMAIILSLTAVSLVVVVIMVGGSRWRRHRSNLQYAPTFDEQDYGAKTEENTDMGTSSVGAKYGFADSTPIHSSTFASC